MKKILKNPKRSNFLNLIKESDRGCVSVVGELFSKRLAGMLILAMFAKVIPKKKIPKKFYNRIKDALALKLITKEQFKAIEAIRDLRNVADHTDCEFSLANEGVIEHLKQLERYAKMINMDRLMDFEDVIQEVEIDENGPRFEFLVTSSQLYNELQPKIYELADRL